MSGLEQRVQYLENQNMLLSSHLERILGKIEAFDHWRDQSSKTMGLFQEWYNVNVKQSRTQYAVTQQTPHT